MLEKFLNKIGVLNKIGTLTNQLMDKQKKRRPNNKLLPCHARPFGLIFLYEFLGNQQAQRIDKLTAAWPAN